MVTHRTMKKCHFRSKIASVYSWNLRVEDFFSFQRRRKKDREILSQMYQIILDKK